MGWISLNLVLNVASGLRLELMYLSLILNIRSSLTHFHGFQLLVLLLQLMEVTFFGLHQPNKSSKSKINFSEAINDCKKVLDATKTAHANKTRASSFPETWLSRLFGKLLIMFSAKVNLLYLLYLMTHWRCLIGVLYV